MYTPPNTIKWCMASESGFNSRNASEAAITAKILRNPGGRCTSVWAGTPRNRRGTVFDPQQPLERDATEPHIWPNVYLADALLREPIRIVRAQLEQTVAWPKHGDVSGSHGTL